MKSAYARHEDLEFDLKQFVYLTDDGQVYLSLLEDLMRLTATT